MPTYHKLVRDRVPEIIKSQGKNLVIETLDKTAYKDELSKKLHEEHREYDESKSDTEALSELADMLEVIYALAITHGCTEDQLNQIRLTKAEKRGGFKERIYLVEADE